MPMATDLYQVDIGIAIKPNWIDVPPLLRLKIDRETLWNDLLYDKKDFEFSGTLTKDIHLLEIELYGKPDLDPHQSLTITDLCFGHTRSQKCVWQGIYNPHYPEPWASQQRSKGVVLEPKLYHTNHLGWNGIWRLEFAVPIFTWIHQVENLGWIYD
jgi:hypothetical protein